MNRLRTINLDLLKSKVVLAVAGGVIVLLIVWWFAWMVPEGNKLTSVQQQVTADQATVAQLNVELAALKVEKALVIRELPYLKKVTAAIPPIMDPPGIVDELNTLANTTHCKLETVTPADVPTASGVTGLSIIPVSFTVSGTHRNVFIFLNGVYTLKRLLTINTLGLAGGSPSNILAVNDGQQYTMSVSANAYTTYVAPVAIP